MEIKVNKEVMAYSESLFMGLGVRQLICSGAAIGVAVGIYFLSGETLGTELTSWACIGAAAPLAALGFFKYNGMTAERALIAFVKTACLSGQRLYHSTNHLYNVITGGHGGSSHY